MALGKTHDRVNLLILSVLVGIFIGLGITWQIWAPFGGGWLIATFIFSPDLDVRPKKRTGILQFVLYPYSLIFKHRGLGHHPILGTFTRLVYGAISIGIIVYFLHLQGLVETKAKDYWHALGEFIVNYNYNIPIYRLLTWWLIGVFCADLCHYGVDWASDGVRKLKGLVFGR